MTAAGGGRPRDEGAGAGGLYLHLPFCSAVCPYCDFAVLPATPVRRARYLAALRREVDLPAADATASPWSFDTVYLGGGTPSLLDPEELAGLLDACRLHLGVADDAWLLLEANPEDVTEARLEAWRSLGVRTLSLGVQSFDDRRIAFLGRRHDARSAERAVRLALEGPFDTVSVDLIYGLPGDDPAIWRNEVERAAALGPGHLSCYQLGMPEGTRLGRALRRGEVTELGDEAQADLFFLTHRRLADLGYEAYEVSNFARTPADRSRHNRKYWDHSPYLGLGLGAHSFRRGRRWWNERRLDRYLEETAAGRRPIAGEEELGRGELVLEALMLGLRTPEGVDLGRLEARYGVDLVAPNRRRIQELERSGRLFLDGSRLRPTLAGLAVADALARSLEVAA